MSTTTATAVAIIDLTGVITDTLGQVAPGLHVEPAPKGGTVRPPSTLPAIRVQQRSALHDPNTGYLSGEIALVLYSKGDSLSPEFNTLKAGIASTLTVDIDANTPIATLPGGIVAKVLILNVRQAVPTIPTLRGGVTRAEADALAQGIARRVSQPTHSDPVEGVRVGSRNSDAQVSSIIADVTSVQIGRVTMSGGVSRQAVDIDLSVKDRKTGMANPAAKASGAVSAFRGQFLPGLGRIESAEHQHPTAKLVIAWREAPA